MRSMRTNLFPAAALLLLLTMRISAHHAFAAEYDENKRVTISGTVTGFKWTNPNVKETCGCGESVRF